MNISELKSKLSKCLDFLKSELAQVRTGRANPLILENISVEAYGSKMTLKELGSITVLDSRNLVVSPWDKSLIKDIGRAIAESELRLNPIIDENIVRVPIPTLTEERRKEFTKIVAVKVEECKNSMRNIRQDAMKMIDKLFSDKELGEDEKFSKKEEVEKLVKEYTSEADKLGDAKKVDLMLV